MKTIRIDISETTGQDRKPYHKFEVKQVLLIPEENVLGGCHTLTSNNGPDGHGCTGGIDQCLDVV
jgi:hypothetical protein